MQNWLHHLVCWCGQNLVCGSVPHVEVQQKTVLGLRWVLVINWLVGDIKMRIFQDQHWLTPLFNITLHHWLQVIECILKQWGTGRRKGTQSVVQLMDDFWITAWSLWVFTYRTCFLQGLRSLWCDGMSCRVELAWDGDGDVLNGFHSMFFNTPLMHLGR